MARSIKEYRLKTKRFTEQQETKMALSERMRTRATILEAGVAATFKAFGEWISEFQGEVTLDVMKEAQRLRREADQIMDQVNRQIHPRFKKLKSRRSKKHARD